MNKWTVKRASLGLLPCWRVFDCHGRLYRMCDTHHEAITVAHAMAQHPKETANV